MTDGHEDFKHSSRPPGPALRKVSVHSRDPREAQSMLSSIHVPLRVESPEGTPFDMDVMAVTCGDVCFAMGHWRSGVRLIFDDPFDGYGMSLPSAGSLALHNVSDEFIESQADSGLMMDSLTVASATFAPRTGWQRIGLGSAQLHAHIALLTEQPVRRRVQFSPHFHNDSSASRFVFAINQALMDGMRGDAPLLSAPAAIASLREAVLSMFVQGIPHSYSELLGRRVASPAPRHVRRAIEFMQAHLKEPLHLEDIARASQTSPRSLQLAFRQFRHMTPMECLRRLRLDGARGELLQSPPGTTVAEVAYRWGFAHHGLFSARYAKLFGETPSATLRRGSH